MPVFFQQQINDHTRLGVWKIEETDAYFKGNVPQHRDVTHPHKRLQHLAGRFLLQFLYPDFPYELVQIADTDKPYLPDEQYHFSISHCGDYAAAIVSSKNRVGVDVEIPTGKVLKISKKFLSEEEIQIFKIQQSIFNVQVREGEDQSNSEGVASIHDSRFTSHDSERLTLLWSAKESVYKWFGNGEVDFKKHIQLLKLDEGKNSIDCFFSKTGAELHVHFRSFDHLVLTWVVT